MIGRLLVLLMAISVLAVLLYVQQRENSGPAAAAAQTAASEPGSVALNAHIIQTGDDGQPLYTLDATRIAQPVANGEVYVTSPILHYTPPAANPWLITADHGQLPQNGHVADLAGHVNATGKPQGSQDVLHFNTTVLHVDMQTNIATTAAVVHSNWAGSLLKGTGMHANMKSGEVHLFKEVSGVVLH